MVHSLVPKILDVIKEIQYVYVVETFSVDSLDYRLYSRYVKHVSTCQVIKNNPSL